MRSSKSKQLLFIILVVYAQNGARCVRRLSQVAVNSRSTQREEVANSEDYFVRTMMYQLLHGSVYNASDILADYVDAEGAKHVLDSVVNLVQQEDHELTKQLSVLLELLSSRHTSQYGMLMSVGFGPTSAQRIMSTLDQLLCLQTTSDEKLCFGSDDDDNEAKAVVEEMLVQQSNFEQNSTDVLTKLSVQLRNKDYISAAWTMVGNLNNASNVSQYSDVIKKAVEQGKGETVGKALLQALRLFARQGESSAISQLMAQLIVQKTYNPELVQVFAKVCAVASYEGLSDTVQLIISKALRNKNGNIQVFAEIIHTIIIQGGENGVEDMALLLGQESTLTQIRDVVVQVLVHALCRGETFWSQFERILDQVIEINTCAYTENVFLSTLALAKKHCPQPPKLQLYLQSPNLEDCNFTLLVPNNKFRASSKIPLPVGTKSYVAKLEQFWDFERVTSVYQEPQEADSIASLPSLESTVQQIVQRAIALDTQHVQNALHVENVIDVNDVIYPFSSSSSPTSEALDNELTSLQQVSHGGYDSSALDESGVILLHSNQREVYDYDSDSDAQCIDILPPDNLTVTCLERKAWGGCEKEWMVESSYCAKTCGYCGNSTQEVQYTKQLFNSLLEPAFEQIPTEQRSKENVNFQLNGVGQQRSKNDDKSSNQQPNKKKVGKQAQNGLVAPSEENSREDLEDLVAAFKSSINVDDQQPTKQTLSQSQTQVESSPDDQCMDIEPPRVSTDPYVSCEQRREWGGCEKAWMLEGQFCAKTCGFCQGQETDFSPEPETASSKQSVNGHRALLNKEGQRTLV
eukprot:TRINITY_DN4021_c0_g1_i9.p1 TRINITY_DN4021_c0_g1~~TRINITY_DN4021_c0_g1_i9.p1  ORF type:complete len:803 (+),score=80.84 TRINITY_DN4021_c0_g1_i9:204-2612(+)